MHKACELFVADRIDVFATAVLRNISNSAQAIAAIEQGAGCSISLLSNADERIWDL